MTGSTKILTVSYGTFSCTLEGFDDPLDSMRDIAEYFRDLAADDRYFGAEPPTPDTEMLQNLAQGQSQRRVMSRVTDTGVAIVAAEPAEQPAPTPTPAAQTDAAGGPLAFDDEYLLSDEPEDVLTVAPNTIADEPMPAESVAEKLRRIRAVVSQSIEEGGTLGAAAPLVDAGLDIRDRAHTQTINDIAADLTDDEDAVRPVTAKPDETDTGRVVSDIIAASKESAPEDVAEDAVADEATHEEAAYEEDSEDSDDGFDQTVSGVLQKLSTTAAEEDTAPDAHPTSAPRAVTKVLSPQPDADVGRLLDETDTKLNDDETVRRRRVISQMRAAVAATKADRSVTPVVSREAAEEAEKSPYRGDLSEVVKEPTKSATPPLMLVSSQRVDEEDGASAAEDNDAAAMATPDAPAQDQHASFADFATSVGAKELDELLEAAAAYTVFAEGQPTFTRPEIMKRVAHADPGLELTREDSLRSFGQLLRKGKFKKLERGQFTIDEDTRFHPSQQIAGE